MLQLRCDRLGGSLLYAILDGIKQRRELHAMRALFGDIWRCGFSNLATRGALRTFGGSMARLVANNMLFLPLWLGSAGNSKFVD